MRTSQLYYTVQQKLDDGKWAFEMSDAIRYAGPFITVYPTKAEAQKYIINYHSRFPRRVVAVRG